MKTRYQQLAREIRAKMTSYHGTFVSSRPSLRLKAGFKRNTSVSTKERCTLRWMMSEYGPRQVV